MSPIVTIPPNFVASTTAVVGQLFTDLSAPIILIVGILLGALVIDIVIGAIHRK